MFEHFEQWIERIGRRVHLEVVCRVHPEVRRVGDLDDRLWVMWFAGQTTAPWLRLFLGGLMVFLGPLSFTLACVIGVELTGWSAARLWPLLCVAGGAAGYASTALLVETVRRSALRQRYFAAMRIVGQDVCPDCGYDLAGHGVQASLERLCPECGGTVRTASFELPKERPRERPKEPKERPSTSSNPQEKVDVPHVSTHSS